MAVTDQQKLDFLLKKIGYTKSKTGNVSGTGDPGNGSPKQPFAEAIPSPLVVANSSLWNEADSIPATPPGSDTVQVKVYLTTSALRLTEDVTSSGARSWIAYSTYNNTSSARLTNWIDTQFGAGYLIKVYKGDPNASGVPLSAGATNNNWFFDYSAGVLNFNDTSVPVTSSDSVYIVGYRYIGQTGAPTSGISTFSYLDLTVERNLDVGVQGGISTFRNNIDLNANLDVSGSSTFTGNIDANGDLDVDGHTELDNVNISGMTTVHQLKLIDNKYLQIGSDNDIQLYHDTNNSYINASGSAGSLFINGPSAGIKLQSDDNRLLDAAGNVIIKTDTNSVNLYFNGGSPKLSTTNTGVSIPQDLDVDGHTNLDNVSIAGFTTITQDLDVDGHTNLDNISVAGVSTFTGDATFSGNVSIGGTLTYEDVTNVDSVGLLTARSGIRVTGGVIEALAGENKIPSLYANYSNLPNASTYHGMFAHVHATGRGYFAHAGNWLELVNADTTGRVGTGTESYFIDRLVSTSTTATSLNVTGVTTAVTVDINGDLDVDGHTNLDNVSIAGVSTFAGNVKANSHINLPDNSKIKLGDSDEFRLHHDNSGNSYIVEGATGNLFIMADYLRIQDASGNNKLTTSAAGVSIPQDLDVDGHTNLDNISVAGVSTFTGNIDANGDLDVDGHTNLDNVSVAGVTTAAGTLRVGTGHTFHDNGNAQIAGIATFYNQIHIPRYYGSGVPTGQYLEIGADEMVMYQRWNGSTSNIEFRKHSAFIGHTSSASGKTLTIQSGAITRFGYIQSNGGTGTYAEFNKAGSGGYVQLYGTTGKVLTTDANGVNILKDLDVDGHTELDNVNIVGVTTAAGHVLPSADSTYDLGSSSKYWRHVYADNITGGGGGVVIGDDIITRNLKVNGISTFIGIATFNGATFHDNVTFGDTITAGGVTGTNGQYLKSVGTGVTWASFPTLRTRDTIVASAGQTSFTFNYTVNFIDVFVNGIKLTDSEFTASNGTSVTLAVGCFVGDIVELVSYNTVSSGGGGGGGTLNNIVEDTSPQLGGNLDLFGKTINGTGGISFTGVVTATTFIGDGSGLTGITASGTGVVIKNNNNTVGTAGTINFADDLSVTPIVAGIVTVGIDTSQINPNKLNVSGISTFNGNINVNADLDVDGHTNLDNVSVAGVSTFASNVIVNGGISNAQYLNLSALAPSIDFNDTNHNSDFMLQNANGLFKLYDNTNTADRVTVASDGKVSVKQDLDVDGHTNLDNVSIAGVVTATTFKGAIEATSASFSSNIDANGDLDVDGHTNLDNVSVAGVTTFASGTVFTGSIDANGDLDVDGHTNLDNVSIAGVTTANGITIHAPTSTSVMVGQDAGFNHSGAAQCVGVGYYALRANTNSDFCTAVGTQALGALGSNSGSSYSGNTAVGHLAGSQMTTASGNTLLGRLAGSAINSNNNTILGIFDGNQGGLDIRSSSNNIVIADGNSNVRFYANSSGNVGINSIAPTSKLDVVGDVKVIGVVTATAFHGDGSNLTGISGSGISTTHVRSNTLVVGENNNVAVSTFHNRVHIPTNDTIYFGDGLDASISYPTAGYFSLYGGASGNMDINTGGNADVRVRAGGDFRVDTDHNEIAIRAIHDGAVELYQNGYGSPTGLRLKTTGVGVTVIGITSMTDNLLVGSAATITPAGAAQFAGIVTASSFVGDGSGLTGVVASGTGVVIKEGGSTVGTAGTINFVGVDVSPASAGIVTVSTATTSITDGNSKLFVNNVSSSNGNGSFEVFLNEFTYGGTKRALNMYQPSDGYGRFDLFHGAAPTTVEINAKTVYSGYARHRLKFETSNASYGGQLDFLPAVGQWNFYSTYQGTQKNVMSFNYSSVGVGGDTMYPITNNATDLGTSSNKFRQFHTTGVNAGVVTATSFTGSGANLTNLPAAQLTGTLPAISGANLTNLPAGTPAYTDVQVAYELTSSSSSGNGWRINGNGFANSTGNPDIYLTRGQKYRFINNSGGSHPFRIQSDASTAYNTGVTGNGNTSGNIDFIPQNSAPAKLYYNCTAHGGMLGVIYIIGEPGRGTTSAATGSIAQAAYADITIPTTGKTFALLKIAISAPAWVVLYTDTSSRTSDAAGTGSGRAEGTDPTPGSGVLAEVSTTTSGASTFKMTPGVIGWNDDGTPATQIYARVYNKRATSGSNAITVTLTTVNIEA